ncbi:PepSY domain-containing protein [Undibacterium sp. Jales W-56]|uniref:PepSY-associated TM helix domain-containing protein n=1 Tax=Undibacterium sp. Jales W-56 TaxID=2897325 RepID=UPI0021D05592|nr:PepSY-associated TM helix domain-containing protein [Undibacterium sp. Jales W-56]MCU6433562.1 PepSY domain-containing protein [Undibacterium sp. Jales W-56]
MIKHLARIPRIKFISRKLHLWIGLLFGMVFVILGLTGSAIAWRHELDHMLNPDLLQASSPSGLAVGAPIRFSPTDIQTMSDTLSANPRYGRPSMLVFPEHAGSVVVAWYRPKTASTTAPLTQEVMRQVMLDPVTLAVTGERNWGELGLSRRLLMPTIFHLHRYLVAGEVGKTVIGVSGLILVLTAMSGIILWWPKMRRKAIWQAITVSHGGSWPRFHFRLHRAAGFFAAPVLLVLGFSGCYFNLPTWIVPAVNAVASVTPAVKTLNRSSVQQSQISPAQAVSSALSIFPQARVSRLALPTLPSAPYEVRLRQFGEIRDGDGATRISIDSGDGRVLRVQDPLRAQAGDTLLNWLFPLHSGAAFGLAGRIFITCFGILPLLFFVTGLAIWIKRDFRYFAR